MGAFQTEVPMEMKNEQLNISNLNFPKSNDLSIGEGVLLQTFYWLSPEGGIWWDTINAKMDEFQEVGFESLWLPAAYKGASVTGSQSMGYEPYDYYDLGSYNQKGGVETRFGSENELRNLIQNANSKGISAIADIVINHNRGGNPEYNPYLELYKDEFEAAYGINLDEYYANTDDKFFTETNFTNVASGQFFRNYTNFHPNTIEISDPGSFINPIQFPDLVHSDPYVWNEILDWGHWLKDDVGFNGWRFDNVVNMYPWVVEEWMNSIGGWGVAELWDGNPTVLENYLSDIEYSASVFDFSLLYRLRDLSTSDGFFDLYRLRDENGLLSSYPSNSVTFVTNHDTERETEYSSIDVNKHLAYAYILTHEGYPSVYWNDYFNPFYQPHIQLLTKIHNNYAKGSTSVLFASSDLYIAQRNGDPGLIIAINDNPSNEKFAEVSTKWVSQKLIDLTGQAMSVLTNENGECTISVPPNSYVIYTVGEAADSILPKIHNFNNPREVPQLNNGTVTIDGIFDGQYGFPVTVDFLDDTKRKSEDVMALYASVDANFLYLAFPYREMTWNNTENLHFGIAISINDTGPSRGPGLHEEIIWNGQIKPNYILYSEINADASSFSEFQNVSLFSYTNEEWIQNSNFQKNIDFASKMVGEDITPNPYGFFECRVKLDDLNLRQSSKMSMLLFTSQVNKKTAADSAPNSDFTYDYGDYQLLRSSWLNMPPYYPIDVPDVVENDDKTDDSNERNKISMKLSVPTFAFSIGILIVFHMTKKKITLYQVEQ